DLDRRFPPDWNISRAGDLRPARFGAGGRAALLPAPALPPRASIADRDRRGRVALYVRLGLESAGNSRGRRIHAVSSGPLLLPPHAPDEPAVGDRPDLSAVRSQPAFRRQLPVVVSGGGGDRRAGDPAARCDVDAIRTRTSRS